MVGPDAPQPTAPIVASHQADFDPIASVYDLLAKIVFGHSLDHAQAQGIATLCPESEIAIFGGGSGRILDQLLALEAPPHSIHFIDCSKKMIKRAQARMPDRAESNSRPLVHFYHQSAADWCVEFPRKVDAAITPFFLDCFEGAQLRTTIEIIADRIGPRGQWLVVDFVASPRVLHRVVMATMLLFFRITCRLPSKQLEDYFEQVRSRGFDSIGSGDQPTLAGPVRWQCYQRP